MERLLALESENVLLREEGARLQEEAARQGGSAALVDRLRESNTATSDFASYVAGQSVDDAAWDALARTAALREALIVVCVELEEAAARARRRLEEMGDRLQETQATSKEEPGQRP